VNDIVMPALMREWELLQKAVVPPLLELDHRRPPRTWSIGCVEDAVAVAVAYEHAHHSDAAPGDIEFEEIELYVALAPQLSGEVGFRLADLRFVPFDSQEAYFIRQDRRWVADEVIAERVLLGDPPAPVDLVTLRPGAADGEIGLDEILERLVPGGHLLVIGTTPGSRAVSDGMEPVEATGAGTVYRKPRRAGSGRATARSQAAAPVQPVPAEPLETVAHRRTQEELVQSHLRLARSLARRFAHHGEPTDDLEQVAMLALVKAAKRFDPGRDTRFATYATSSILGELKRHFRDKTWMLRVPRSVQETYLSVKQARDELTHTLGASPTVQAIAAHLGTTEAAVLDAMRAGDNFWPASLDARNANTPNADLPMEDDSLDQTLDRLQVRRLLPGLDDREQLVLKRLYFEDCTQREVAAELGVSQMQVSRLLARALSKLRS